MATHEELKQIASLAMTDVAFRIQLVKDPKAAADQLKIQLDPEQMAGLEKAAQAIEASGNQFDPRLYDAVAQCHLLLDLR